MSEMSDIYKAIQQKRGETKELSIKSLTLSEFNTRSSFIDWNHVKALAERIREEGFDPGRAIGVNVILDASGQIVVNRAVTGAHRLKASELAGNEVIPCNLYCGLTDEEECLLDSWDNRKDEIHKPFNFLQEAEHFKYLRDVKHWGVRTISKYKNVARGAVSFKLQIADIPKEAKEIIKKGMDCFYERYFRDICKLQDSSNIILICKEILDKYLQAIEMERDNEGNIIQTMKKEEIKERVEELLEKEKNNFSSSVRDDFLDQKNAGGLGNNFSMPNEGLIAENATNIETYVNVHPGGRVRSDSNNTINIHQKKCGTLLDENETIPSQKIENDTLTDHDKKNSLPKEQEHKYSLDELMALSEEQFKCIPEDVIQNALDENLKHTKPSEAKPIFRNNDKWRTSALKLITTPNWVIHSNIPRELGKFVWPLYWALLCYNMRYHEKQESQKKDFSFFLGGVDTDMKKTCKFLNVATALKPETISKKLLFLEKEKFIVILRPKLPPTPRFQINWGHIAQLFIKQMYNIPFEEGGLMGMPKNYTGMVQASPYDTLPIFDGKVSEMISEKKLDLFDELVYYGVSQKKASQLIYNYSYERIEGKLIFLRIQEEKYRKQGKMIRNFAGFLINAIENDYR